MKRSADRILTTHVGSLPRPNDLLRIVAKARGERSTRRSTRRVREAVAEVVRKQVELGIDVIDDGEYRQAEFRHLYQRAAGRLRGR